MKNPQTFCKELSEMADKGRFDTIYKNGCCAFVYLWCLGIEPDNDIDAILTLNDMISAKVIGADCTVYWAEAGRFLTGRNITVDFVPIKDLRGIKERTPVRYDYKGKSHWVGVEKGMIKFNPLGYSECVEKGRPVTCRKIKILKD